MGKAIFSMAFHCYQPVFNFDWELENAFKTAYLPLLETLENFPEVKASFHYSGNMLEWFSEKHPDYIDKIAKLLGRGQIELISGGCFEPIMILIPERDRYEQLKINEGIIARLFNVKPEGAWLAERVWQPDLAATFSRAGIKYTIVDDHHIFRAGLDKNKIFAPCVTGSESSPITLFPALTPLRYFIPFQQPDFTMNYFKNIIKTENLDSACFFFADDGEKFGAWPHTYKWVHKKGWLKRFFGQIRENSDWLQTMTYSEVLSARKGGKVNHVPGSSYAEMMQWCGGDFNNFLKKYPEVNRMHKRMIFVSDMLHRIASDKENPASTSRDFYLAKRELFKAQTSCAYWHGTFGGFYLPHLRSGVYKHLIKAQGIAEGIREREKSGLRAIRHDLDGKRSEVVLGNKSLDVFIASGGAAVTELDYKKLQSNLVNTISRVKEDYHKKLGRHYYLKINQARKAVQRGENADIHDVLGLGERGLRKVLGYDDYERLSFLSHIFRERKPWEKIIHNRASYDNFLKGAYSSRTEADKTSIACILSKRDKIFTNDAEPLDIGVLKKILVGPEEAVIFTHKILNHSDRPYLFKYAVEFNFLIWDNSFSLRPRLWETDRFSMRDKFSDIKVDFTLNKRFTIFTYPIYSVNETEKGLRKNFQGISILIGDEVFLDAADETEKMEILTKIG